MPHPRAAFCEQMPHDGDRQPVKCPSNARGMGGLGIDRAIMLSHAVCQKQTLERRQCGEIWLLPEVENLCQNDFLEPDYDNSHDIYRG